LFLPRAVPSNYEKISADHTVRYGTDVANFGRDFAERYTERTHFIFELEQNAEDALRWRRLAEPQHSFPRSLRFRLFPDHLEVSHFGLPFTEEHVRAICSIKRGTKVTSLTDIGKFGIGFKSVFAYSNRPEVHSGDEHFAIIDFVHPEATPPRATQPGETLFYLPFDVVDVPPSQAHAEISARLNELGLRSLLFLGEIETVEWDVIGGKRGTYTRRARATKHWKEVSLVGRGAAQTPAIERWMVFSRPVTNPAQEPAGHVEIAFLLQGRAKHLIVTRAEDSNLFVFFPTEKETHCGFLIQGPYKTTPGRDNIPHDNSWNAFLVAETATLVRDALTQLAKSGLASVGLLEALPLFRSWEKPSKWMFEPIYDAVLKVLRSEPLIPAANNRHVSARRARISRDRGLIDLFRPEQLTRLITPNDEEKYQWVAPEISDSRSSAAAVCDFLQEVLSVSSYDAAQFVPYLDEDFFQGQSDRWMIRFYRYLLDHERLWRIGTPRGPLLAQKFIRVEPETHVAPFDADGKPNVYLPDEEATDYVCVHAPIAASKSGAEFFRKLGLTSPDITAEVLHKIVPQYESDTIDLSDAKHAANLQKIVRAMASDSPHQPELMRQLRDVYFLQITETGKKGIFYAQPGSVYFRTGALETYFDGEKGVYFLNHIDDALRSDKVVALLKQLGIADEPRRRKVRRETDYELKKALRGGGGFTWDSLANYDLHGLGNFIRRQRKMSFTEASRRARLLWDFMIRGWDVSQRAGVGYFRGTYEWKYYSNHSKSFDAHFLEVLRSKAWLPGRDGRLHRPSDLLPRELPASFTRHAGLCEALQLKADVLVELARKAGIRLEDLTFIRNHRDEFDTFKQNVKTQGVPNATPLVNDLAPTANGQSVNHDTSDQNGRPHNGRGGGGARSSNESQIQDEVGPPNGDSEPSQNGTYATYLYVAADGSTAESHARNSERSEERKTVGSLGVDVVSAYEQSQGRNPKQMPQTHEGYDVESCDASGKVERYIEVKTIRTGWGERGVTLTSAQFEAARQHKGLYWLYVVENPGASNQRIYRIWNPGDMARWYVFDQGWWQLAEPDMIESK
jgi:hypothetical protein